MIEIQNGCTPFPVGHNESLSWKYVDAKSAGIITIYFTAPYGVKPKIGDFINEDNFTLVPRTEYKIVPDLVQPEPDDDYIFRR